MTWAEQFPGRSRVSMDKTLDDGICFPPPKKTDILKLFNHKNIARGTTDPGYWVYKLNHVSDWSQFEIILAEKDHSSYGLNTLVRCASGNVRNLFVDTLLKNHKICHLFFFYFSQFFLNLFSFFFWIFFFNFFFYFNFHLH